MSFWFNLYFSFLKISLFKKNLLLEQIGREIKKKKKKKDKRTKWMYLIEKLTLYFVRSHFYKFSVHRMG